MKRVRNPARRSPQALEPQPSRLPRHLPQLAERKTKPGVQSSPDNHGPQYGADTGTGTTLPGSYQVGDARPDLIAAGLFWWDGQEPAIAGLARSAALLG